MSTNPYPAVYRPTFYRDPATGNIFVNGYELVPTVSGLGDPVFTQPVDITALVAGNIPAGMLNSVNVYGVPWIIGARKGFPSFNELYMLTSAQVLRLMRVNLPSVTGSSGNTTNKQYILSITNFVGMSCWNSYYSNYYGSSNLTIYMQDTMSMALTNGDHPSANLYSPATIFYTNFYSNYWPGSGWTSPNYPASVNPASFAAVVFTNTFLPPSAYYSASGNFVNINEYPFPWETNVPDNYPFPHFGLMITNWAQAIILDGNHVIDYVQLSGPNSSQNLNVELADAPSTGMWSTNAYGRNNPAGFPTFGEVDQILYSMGVAGLPIPPGEATFVGTQQQALFSAFCEDHKTYSYGGVTYPLTYTSLQAPYTPERTLFNYTLWQANDPLVHYLASDLNCISPALTGLQVADNGAPILILPGLNISQVGPRYQPWGLSSQMSSLVGIDTNAYNLAFRDPLVVGSDAWNFPTIQTWNPNWLGQIHRGTPWQTIYLKSTNLLDLVNFRESSIVSGLNTWEAWTGNTNEDDAIRTAPVIDWHVAALLTAILNTNSSLAYFSVNNPDPNAWAADLDGLIAITNGITGAGIILTSNSPTVTGLAGAIETMRASLPGQEFQDQGEVFATPQLSIASPFLVAAGSSKYGINDAAYEALPSQLLAQLGVASQGTLISTNGQWIAQFTGAVGHSYVLQSSPDLVHWTSLGRSSPINGQVSFGLPAATSGAAQFYRSQIIQ
jgi:hypothetical protein